MKENLQNQLVEIEQDVLTKWQDIVDIIAELIDIPAALIMRLVESDIEVFVSSKSEDNPYRPRDHEHFLGSGLYCETVINTNDKLLVPNALTDEKWKNNPDIKLNMISYLGFPITLPDGRPFGTICVLDNKENAYSETYENLIKSFREIIQSHLALIYMNTILGEKNKSLSDYIAEIKILRGIVPICCVCGLIRDDTGVEHGKGGWLKADKFVIEKTDAHVSHTYCPICYEKAMEDDT
ncbi:GAF domain-containing protein [Desulfopila sp. IMCC35008]|uniref:GAF domain-containing protein n=1 Tax=Desulfopila sp. IMCC35008 TaxID=2653858 RepID=UPI0013D3EFBC|nr:GAF domain-containing protein [Desulfopila sp. IMCC35008]